MRPSRKRAGNAGCPLHPRPRVHLVLVERTRVTTSTPESPDIPARNGFNGFLRALVSAKSARAHERFLRTYLPGTQDSISGQCAHKKSKDHDELSFAFRAVRLQAIIIADDKAIIPLRHDFGHRWPLSAPPLSRIARSAVQHGGSILLHLCRVRTTNLLGDMQTPHQTLAVQALRNTRCVEEIAHGRSSPFGLSRFGLSRFGLSRSSNRTQYTAS